MAEEKEVIEAEEVKEEETKKETSNGGTKYHLIRENFNRALTFAIVILGITTLHFILEFCVDGNLPWFIINVICTAGLIVFGVLSLKLFLDQANPNRNKDLATFIIVLVAFIYAFLMALVYGTDGIRNLIGFIRDLSDK